MTVTTIADFQTRKGRWVCGPAICLACKHEWEVAAPVGTYEFECPECHAIKGVGKTFLGSADEMYMCSCGCFIFSIRWTQGQKPIIICAGCGLEHPDWSPF